jgi:hypothetical protein
MSLELTDDEALALLDEVSPPANETKQAPTADDGMYKPSVEDIRSLTPGLSDTAIQQIIAETEFEPTPSEYGKATLAGTGRGLAEGSTFVGAAAAANRVLGPVTDLIPAGRGIKLATKATQMVGAGVLANEGLGDIYEQMFPRPTDDKLLPYYEGARTFGGGLGGFSVLRYAPNTLLRSGPAPDSATRVEKMVSAIIDSSKSDKKGFKPWKKPVLIKELMTNAWVGTAGGMSVANDPEALGQRFGVEVGASLLNPTKLIYNTISGLNDEAQRLQQQGVPVKIQNQVAEVLERLLTTYGEDTSQIIPRLEKEIQKAIARGTQEGQLPTVGQMGVSPALTALDKRLQAVSHDYLNDSNLKASEAFQTIRALTKGLINSGDPEAVTLGVRMLDDHFASQFNMALASAEARAMDAAKKLGPRASEDRAAVGNLLKDEIHKIVRTFRDTETQLWEEAINSVTTSNKKVSNLNFVKDLKVPKKTEPRNLIRAYVEHVKGPQVPLADEELANVYKAALKELDDYVLNDSPEVIDNFVRFGKQTEEFSATNRIPDEFVNQIRSKETEVSRLIQIRSSNLKRAREIGPSNPDAARVFNELAQGALEDLQALNNPAYAEATAFSKKLNDVLTRTFAGDADKKTRTGAAKYSPETLIQRMFSGGSDAIYLRNQEIIRAVNALDLPNVPSATSVIEAQRDAVKAWAARDVVRNIEYPGEMPSTAQFMEGVKQGKKVEELIDPKKFDQWRKNNESVLRVLGLEDDFADINKAAFAIADATDPNSLTNQTLRNQKTLQKFIGGADPALVLGNILKGDYPKQDFKKLVDRLRSVGGEDADNAIDGLKKSIFQYALQQADGAPSNYFQTLEKSLFGNISPNVPSVMRLMAENRMLKPGDVRLLRQNILAPAKKIEQAMGQGEMIPENITKYHGQIVATVEELIVQHLSARAASQVSPGGPGSLAWASSMIKKGKNYFNKMPARQRDLLLMKLMQEPDLMLNFMKGHRTADQKKLEGLSVLKILFSPEVSTGNAVRTFIQDSDFEEDPTETPTPPKPIERPQASRMLKNLPTVNTRGLPKPGGQQPAPQQTAQAPAAPQGGSPNQSSREMLQKLFPMDQVLG